jgi:hypothetical protein
MKEVIREGERQLNKLIPSRLKELSSSSSSSSSRLVEGFYTGVDISNKDLDGVDGVPRLKNWNEFQGVLKDAKNKKLIINYKQDRHD